MKNVEELLKIIQKSHSIHYGWDVSINGEYNLKLCHILK